MRSDPVFIGSEVYRRRAYRPNHPLGIPRVETATDLCAVLGWLDSGFHASPVATIAELTKFHRMDYVEALLRAEEIGLVEVAIRERYGIGTLENPTFPGLFERASTSVGGSILAAKLALEGRVAYHPAGGTHHGRPDRASGFCYFNDPVFAILTLLEAGAAPILYADLDAHHGDGVQDAFVNDPRVFTASIHEAGRWPGTGSLEDRGQGRACNLPVPARCNDSEFEFLMSAVVLPLAGRIRPAALVVTCGADPLKGDPLSKMDLSNVVLWDAVEALTKMAPSAVVLGGGGYNPWTVARCWAGLWGRLTGRPMPVVLPAEAQMLLARLNSDLLEEDERDPAWITTLADPGNPGPIRGEVKEIAGQARLANGL
jgi:acetoin utilization protein AcuC